MFIYIYTEEVSSYMYMNYGRTEIYAAVAAAGNGNKNAKVFDHLYLYDLLQQTTRWIPAFRTNAD